MKTAKISSKNQITLPQSALTALGIKKGHHILLEWRKDGVLLRSPKKNIADTYYGYARQTWRKLGGGERFIAKERKQWGK